MSLRIRRGTDAQRQTVLFDQGELVYTTDTQKLYVGDGTTTGGNAVGASLAGTGLIWNSISQTLQATNSGGLSAVVGDTAPQLGGSLSLNNHNITGTGNINNTGTITASGAISSTGGGISAFGAITGATISATTGLGANLPLNGYSITGTGNIAITGNINNNGNISASQATLTALNTAFINVPDGGLGLHIDSIIGAGVSANFYAGSSLSPTSIGTGPGNGMTFALKGYNGTSYAQAGVIISYFDSGANLSDAQPKSTIVLSSGGGGSNANYAGLNSSGVFLAPAVMLAGPGYSGTGNGGYNGSSNYPSPAYAGMMIFDSSNSHFYGYNGTAWKQLDN